MSNDSKEPTVVVTKQYLQNLEAHVARHPEPMYPKDIPSRLNLCHDHRQESNQSHYDKHNCDHCKVLAKLEQVSKPSTDGINHDTWYD